LCTTVNYSGVNNAAAICLCVVVPPDMVQRFRARIVTASKVLLEWKPPARRGVAKYKVSALVTSVSDGQTKRLRRRRRLIFHYVVTSLNNITDCWRARVTTGLMQRTSLSLLCPRACDVTGSSMRPATFDVDGKSNCLPWYSVGWDIPLLIGLGRGSNPRPCGLLVHAG